MKIVSWNVNGIRSVWDKGFLTWLRKESPDIVCLQEIKADSAELIAEITEIDGYYAYFNSAQKKGYSGVAVYTKIKPLSVEKTFGHERFDFEGRGLKLIFKDFTLFNFYIPNGGRTKEHFGYKFEVYEHLGKFLKEHTTKKTIVVGDFNIAHQEIDLHAPKQNIDSTMFTSAERERLSQFISLGFHDSLRVLYPEKKDMYTWWSYMEGIRERNLGWRIDYIFVSEQLKHLLTDAYSSREVPGSDHGPYTVVMNLNLPIEPGPVYKREQIQQSSLF